MHAIDLNGQAPDRNKRAFDIGRWAYLHPAEADGYVDADVVELPKTLEEKIAFRVDHLTKYQDAAYADRYTSLVAKMPEELREAVAMGYHKLLAYKDEYEVARLICDTRAKAEAEFDGDLTLSYHMAPPILGGLDANGRPKKREFGAWFAKLAPMLARMKSLRGTSFDLFGRTEERKMERALIAQYEADIAEVMTLLTADNRSTAQALAELPLEIRGFGPVKAENAAKAAKTREALLASLREGSGAKYAAE